ncbi:MAG: hypothetical protein IJ125_07025 [Atopobiaceae bacterium]|nr:hypothetical protein [Atopobiaceae bacterium]
MALRSEQNAKNTPPVESSGVAKRSAARAKPARSIATGVRVEAAKKSSGAGAKIDKADRKTLREMERQKKGSISYTTDILCKADDEFVKNKRIWWILFGVGFVLAAMVAVIVYLVPKDTPEALQAANIASIVVMVLAYVFIIASLVWDWRKVRKIRFAMENKAHGMTPKKRQQIIDEYEAAKAARKAAKKGETHTPADEGTTTVTKVRTARDAKRSS